MSHLRARGSAAHLLQFASGPDEGIGKRLATGPFAHVFAAAQYLSIILERG